MPDGYKSPVLAPTGAVGWTIETSAPGAGAEHRSSVRVYVSPRTRSRLTAAGMVAMYGQLTGYLSAAKLAAIFARSAGQDAKDLGFQVTRDHAWVDILPEDFATVSGNLSTVLQAAANTTSA